MLMRRVCSGVTSGHHGWTVALVEGPVCYESPGHGYVLDLLGEMEAPPGLPCTHCFLIIQRVRTPHSSAATTRRYAEDSYVITQFNRIYFTAALQQIA